MRRRQIEGPVREELIAKARELRRTGATTREIATALGIPRRGSILEEACRGEPAHPRTGRTRAKDQLRDEAVALRLEGRSYSEIAAKLAVSTGSLSLWLRHVELPPEIRAELDLRKQRGAAAGGAGKRAATRARDDYFATAAREWLGSITAREALLVGVVAYWCEGSKSKPSRARRQVTFLNSDPDLIRVFLVALELLGIPRDEHTYRVCIHELADVRSAEEFWADAIGVPVSSFQRATLKTHNPRTVRHNVGSTYRGCVSVRVKRSADLYRRIAGIFGAVAAGLDGCVGAPFASDLPAPAVVLDVPPVG